MSRINRDKTVTKEVKNSVNAWYFYIWEYRLAYIRMKNNLLHELLKKFKIVP